MEEHERDVSAPVQCTLSFSSPAQSIQASPSNLSGSTVKRRGRPPKSTRTSDKCTENFPTPTDTSIENAQSGSFVETPPKRKRGRPPKSENAGRCAVAESPKGQTDQASHPNKVDRKLPQINNDDTSSLEDKGEQKSRIDCPPRKRGRPPKASIEICNTSIDEREQALSQSENAESLPGITGDGEVAVGEEANTKSPSHVPVLYPSVTIGNSPEIKSAAVLKRGRGRPPKNTAEVSLVQTDTTAVLQACAVDADDQPVVTHTPVTASRKRGRTPKSQTLSSSKRTADLSNIERSDLDACDSPVLPTPKRARHGEHLGVGAFQGDSIASEKLLATSTPKSINQSSVTPSTGPKKRGRPPKKRTLSFVETATSKVPPVSSKWGSPPLDVNAFRTRHKRGEITESKASSQLLSQSLNIPRKRGRPAKLRRSVGDHADGQQTPASGKHRLEDRQGDDIDHSTRHTDKDSEAEMDSNEADGDEDPTTKKETLDVELQQKTGGGKKRRGRPKKGKKVQESAGPRKCYHCDQVFEGFPALKKHFLDAHHRLYSASDPEGIQNFNKVFKHRGNKLNCLRCSKEFQNVSTGRFHIKWCGKEGETITCDTCGQNVRAMKLHSHKRIIHGQLKKQQTDVRKEEEVQEETGGRQKRAAAARAMKTLKEIHELEVQEHKSARGKKEKPDGNSTGDEAVSEESEYDVEEENVAEKDFRVASGSRRTRDDTDRGVSYKANYNLHLSDKDTDKDSEAEMDSNEDEADGDEDPTTKKETLDAQLQQKTGGGKKRRERPKKGEKVQESAGPRKCYHCDQVFDRLHALKKHFLDAHHRLYTTSDPEGIQNFNQVFKNRGNKLNCLRCSKEFQNVTTGRFHIKWCGKEDETVTCHTCGQTVRAMKLPAHERIIHRQFKKPQTDVRKEEQVQEETGGRKKRAAAARAMETLKEIHEIEVQDHKIPRGEKEKPDGNWTGDESEYDEEENVAGKAFRVASGGRRTRVASWSRRTRDDADRGVIYKANYNWHLSADTGDMLYPEWSPQVSKWKALSAKEVEDILPLEEFSPRFHCTKSPSQPAAGEQSKEPMRLRYFQTQTIHNGCVVSAGGPIWSLAWCPTPVDAVHTQYLAAYAHQDPDMVTKFGGSTVFRSLLQVWRCGPLSVRGEGMQPQLVYCIELKHGAVWDMKWCPLGAWKADSEEEEESSDGQLGLLALATSSGDIPIYSLPSPEALSKLNKSTANKAEVDAVVYQVEPVICLRPTLDSEPSCSCLCVDWAFVRGCSTIAAGYGDGSVCAWDLRTTSPLLRHAGFLRPHLSMIAHSMAVMGLALCRQEPRFMLTCSLDRLAKHWDLQRPDWPLSSWQRGALTHVTWPLHSAFGFVAGDDCYCFEHNCSATIENGYMEGPGRPITVHNACVWSQTFSDGLNVLVTCDVTGMAMMNQMVPLTRNLKYVKCIPKKRALLCKTSVEDNNPPAASIRKQNGCSESTDDSADQSKTLKTCRECYRSQTINMVEYDKLHDRSLIYTKSLPLYDPSTPPLRALHRITWNPNFGSQNWLAYGGQAGLLRIRCIGVVADPNVHSITQQILQH